MGKNQHVTPHPQGGWQVKGAGNSRATVRTAPQKEAIAAGRIIAQNQHCTIPEQPIIMLGFIFITLL